MDNEINRFVIFISNQFNRSEQVIPTRMPSATLIYFIAGSLCLN